MSKASFLKILFIPFQFAKSSQFFTTRSVETYSDFYLFVYKGYAPHLRPSHHFKNQNGIA